MFKENLKSHKILKGLKNKNKEKCKIKLNDQRHLRNNKSQNYKISNKTV